MSMSQEEMRHACRILRVYGGSSHERCQGGLNGLTGGVNPGP